MNIYITFDYEIYFGEKTGTAKRCLIEPTQELISIAEKHGARFTFFVDCGYLLKLKENRTRFPELEKDYVAVSEQIKLLHRNSHDIQLHVHPHWEDAVYENGKWKLDIRRYRIDSFDEKAIDKIFSSYISVLEELTGKKPSVFRAGGWCIQPFGKIKDVLKKHNILMDSTVYRNGYHAEGNYAYDFRKSPDKDKWMFEEDPAEENPGGSFQEFPIASAKLSPLFFWKLFAWGRLDPYNHKPLGDGVSIQVPGYRKKLLTEFTQHCVSVDGYFSTLLEKTVKEYSRKNFNELVIIGHPKALTRFSLSRLENFIQAHHKKHIFTSFTKQYPGS